AKIHFLVEKYYTFLIYFIDLKYITVIVRSDYLKYYTWFYYFALVCFFVMGTPKNSFLTFGFFQKGGFH
ncbi:MAG: hypothetical protein FWC10_05550, partial [Lentimicrobiaceae bacterium]|nr:hypothetical protein [Lentimicrobiaceae bacterium]